MYKTRYSVCRKKYHCDSQSCAPVATSINMKKGVWHIHCV